MNELNNNENSIVSNETENKKYVLYHAANAGCYVKCLIHKCLFHPNDSAIFIGYSWLSERFGKPDKYVKYLDYDQTFSLLSKEPSCTPQKLLNKIVSKFDILFDENNISLKNISDIYIGSYYGDFSIYINYMGLKHSIFEEGAGEFNNLLYTTGANCYNTLLKQFNMESFDNDLVIKRFCVIEATSNENKKNYNFEAYKEIYNLTPEDKKYIMDFFGLPSNLNINSDEYNVLLLTQWFFINGSKWRDETIIEFYKVILDYYLPYSDKKINLFIKPHPADPFSTKYQYYFKDCTIISSDCISEILGLIPNIHFDLSITVSSSSLMTVAPFSERCVKIGYYIINFYKKLNTIYLFIKDFFDFTNCCEIYRYGIMDETYKLLTQGNKITKSISWHDLHYAGDSLIICDLLKWSDNEHPIDIEKISRDTVVAFINIENLFLNYNGNIFEILDNSVILELKTDGVKLDHIICFSKNENQLDKIHNFSISKYFNFQDKVLECYSLNNNDSRLIKIEWMLKYGITVK